MIRHPQESVQLAVLEGARVGSDKPLKKHARLRSEGLSSRESIGPWLAQMPRIAGPMGLGGGGAASFWWMFWDPKSAHWNPTIGFFSNGYLESSWIHLFLIGIFPQGNASQITPNHRPQGCLRQGWKVCKDSHQVMYRTCPWTAVAKWLWKVIECLRSFLWMNRLIQIFKTRINRQSCKRQGEIFNQACGWIEYHDMTRRRP